MNWNPLKLEPPFKVEEGIIIAIVRYFLAIPKYPANVLHNFLKSIVGNIVKNTNGSEKKIKDYKGIYIELWVVACAILNSFFVLPYFACAGWTLWSIAGLFLISRSADFVDNFIVLNFYLSFKKMRKENQQRSVARSYMLLITNFLEVAAIFGSLHFIICGQFLTNCHNSEWGDLYNYAIMNMLTIGDNITYPKVHDSFWWFNFFKIAQPMFGGLFLSVAIGRIIDWKDPEKK